MGYVRLLRQRRVLVLWGAQTLSVFGDRMYALAIMWVAWEQAGAGAMGLVAIAESLPYILMGTFGRRIVARCTSLRALAILDVVRAVLLIALPFAWEWYGVPGLLVFALLLGICGSLFDPNLHALVPDFVAPRDVQAVVGLMDLSGRIARIAGPGAAGALLAIIPMRELFWIDSATFVVSAIALVLLARRVNVRSRVPVSAAMNIERPRASRLLRSSPDVGVAILVAGFGTVAGACALAMPALLEGSLDAGAGAYGAILAATGGGALVANLVAGNWRLPGPPMAIYCGVWALLGMLMAANAGAFSVVYLFVVAALTGMVTPFLPITLNTHLAGFSTPARLRLITVNMTVARTTGTLAMLFLPALAAADPARGFAVSGVSLAAIALLGALAAALLARRSNHPDERARPSTQVDDSQNVNYG